MRAGTGCGLGNLPTLCGRPSPKPTNSPHKKESNKKILQDGDDDDLSMENTTKVIQGCFTEIAKPAAP